jgi:UTP-glucose-1-phosphate uridylyltransferase/mevalonate kinase
MELFVPGRICLFGEHSDWAGGYRRVNPSIEKGYTLICGTDQGIYARVEPHPAALVLTATTPGGKMHGPYEMPMEPQALLDEAQCGGFWSYVAGVAYQAMTHYQVRGLVIDNYQTDLPIQKGLSSSAAICVLAARAFNQIYDLKLTVRGEMELAYQGEITTPSRCGRMDQGCAFGNRPVLMTFNGDRLETSEVQVSQDLYLVIADLRAHKDTMEILAQLNRCYPAAGDEVARGVQRLLGPINRRIVGQAVTALQAGDAQQLGALMNEAQALFDRYAMPACPGELAAPVLHRVLSCEPLQPHVWGGKGVGSQGDGAAQFVACNQASQQAVVEIMERELGMPCLTLTLRGPQGKTASRSSGGAIANVVTSRDMAPVRKAVIPAAGLGTRLYPATKVAKKELFPIVDRDGIAKPALLLIVEEALSAGVEEVILIVGREDLDAFQALFAGPTPSEIYGKLPPSLQAYASHILELGRHVSFVIQPTQEGFGHAVYRTREAVGDEPFLLMLGDHLYHSNNQRTCAQQLVQAFASDGTSLLALRHTPESEVHSYGCATGTWLEPGRLLDVAELAEKPTVDYARSNLRVSGMPEGEYLTIFGLYLLRPRVFDYLEEHVAGDLRERGEFQLTTAIERLRESEGLRGLVVDGHSFDIGLPGSYVETVRAFDPR